MICFVCIIYSLKYTFRCQFIKYTLQEKIKLILSMHQIILFSLRIVGIFCPIFLISEDWLKAPLCVAIRLTVWFVSFNVLHCKNIQHIISISMNLHVHASARVPYYIAAKIHMQHYNLWKSHVARNSIRGKSSLTWPLIIHNNMFLLLVFYQVSKGSILKSPF